MPLETEEIPCNFVGKFKVGDNLVFNSGVLCNLAEANIDGCFNKPIVLQVGSLLEAALLQIIFRAQHYNLEGVPNIAEADRLQIADKKIDKFSVVIDVLRKYEVLHPLEMDIYEELHKLRRYRNKIHIQDDIGIPGVPRYEGKVFNDANCEWALALNLKVLKYLSEELQRPERIPNYAGVIRVPC